MKSMKKLLAFALVLVMLSGLALTASATSDVEAPAAATKGSITVKNATKGYEYNAYKVFDATYSGTKVSYKTPATNASKLDNTLFGWSTAADEDGNISVWKLDTATDSAVTDWISEHYADFGGTAIPGAFDEANSTVTFSNLAFGYYYITSGLGTVVTIDSAFPTAEVYDKNETAPVAPAKTIVSVDGKTVDNLKEADAHVGSVVGFKVTAKTNNWIDKDHIREKWELTDTATNMFIDPESIVVKVNGTQITNYTAAGDGNGGMTLNIPMVDDSKNSIYPANLDTTPGLIPIEITYSATILKEAASAPAKNEIPGDGTTVYTYAFQIAKTDGEEQPLPGAQFELWSTKGATGEGATAAALTFIDNGDGTYTYSESGTVTTLDMTTNTTIVVKGLDNGWTYTLKETKVPDGYNQAADIEIAGSSLTKVSETTTEADGTTTTTAIETSVTSTALHKETVINKQGLELPSTGGIGTTLFYILGTILVLGAGVVLVTKRRVQE